MGAGNDIPLSLPQRLCGGILIEIQPARPCVLYTSHCHTLLEIAL